MVVRFDSLDVEEFAQYLSMHTHKEASIRYGVSVGSIGKWARRSGLKLKSFRRRNGVPNRLNNQQLEVITGSMLGDGSLRKVPTTTNQNSLFEEDHCQSQRLYSQWKAMVLDSFLGRLTKQKVRSISHPAFSKLERQWYQRDDQGGYALNKYGQRIKILPPDLRITPLSLAVWYYDDGCNESCYRRASFATNSFSHSECERLIEILATMGLTKCKLKPKYDKDNQWMIFVSGECYFDLLDMVKDSLPIDCFGYKVRYKHPNYSTRFRSKNTL